MTTPQPAALPELPEPSGVIFVGTQAMRAFTADQMRAYALAALQAQPAEVSEELIDAAFEDLHPHHAHDRDLAVRSGDFAMQAVIDKSRKSFFEGARAILALRPQCSYADADEWLKATARTVEAGCTEAQLNLLRIGFNAGKALRPQEVPMTYEQMRATLTEAGYDDANFQARADFINGVRYGEAHHGITAPGAQDGEG